MKKKKEKINKQKKMWRDEGMNLDVKKTDSTLMERAFCRERCWSSWTWKMGWNMHSVVIWVDIIFSGFVLQGAGKPFYRKVGFYIL